MATTRNSKIAVVDVEEAEGVEVEAVETVINEIAVLVTATKQSQRTKSPPLRRSRANCASRRDIGCRDARYCSRRRS